MQVTPIGNMMGSRGSSKRHAGKCAASNLMQYDIKQQRKVGGILVVVYSSSNLSEKIHKASQILSPPSIKPSSSKLSLAIERPDGCELNAASSELVNQWSRWPVLLD